MPAAAQFLRPPAAAATVLTQPTATAGVDGPTGHAWALAGSTLVAWPIAGGDADACGADSRTPYLSVDLAPGLASSGPRYVELLEPVREGGLWMEGRAASSVQCPRLLRMLSTPRASTHAVHCIHVRHAPRPTRRPRPAPSSLMARVP